MRLPRALDDDAGFSLAEIMVTIVIVGIAFAAILGGMATSIVVSDVHRKQASADALARSAAEALKDQGVAYVDCAGPNAYDSALPTDPSGVSSASISSIEYWDGNLTSTDPATFSGSCGQDHGVQLITVVASGGQATETVQFVKRRGT
jgi:prepilin-type N-terminal cleavage/methylation domain-containing protein